MKKKPVWVNSPFQLIWLTMVLTAWQLFSTLLVYFMAIPGLALFYGGLVRRKNVLSIIVQCFVIAALMTLLWVLVGYSLAFGNGHGFDAWLGDFSDVTLHNLMRQTGSISLHKQVFMLYQMGFAIITPALIIGAFAERMKFSAIIVFTIVWGLIVYCPICHWFWGGGWLQKLGVLDFAGGSVVHLNAGIAGLVAAILVGKREHFAQGHLRPHNLSMVAIGAGILWFGWFGFNSGGSSSFYGVVLTVLNTQIAAAAGALGWMFVEWRASGKPSALCLILGAIAGLVAITPACGYVGPMASIFIGAAPSMICAWLSRHKLRLHIDDSLDAFYVHGVAGAIGSLLTGFFVMKSLGGSGLKNDIGVVWQLIIQVIGIVSVILWSGLWSYLILKVLDKTIGLRVCRQTEARGLDVGVHGEKAYDQ